MVGSAEDWTFGWEPWTAPALEDLLPELSGEEQVRLQSYLREHGRILKWKKKNSPTTIPAFRKRDASIIHHARYALHHYNVKHPGEEFDAVKPLMADSVRFKGQMWFHVNFWARFRKSKKIKRFFAEVHYKPPGSSSVCSNLPYPVPGAEKPPSSSSVFSDVSFSVPKAEKPSSSSSIFLDLPLFPVPIPIVEACTIIKEPLGRYRRSCPFCRGHLDILHPIGAIEQRLQPCGSIGLDMPFTCRLGQASPNSQEEEVDKRDF
ncbi:hypothetical protein PVAP13_4KG050800 [Panicum virgatum]|uniref:DUF3615 domain-containing protein n=1 Tax=Panicum virgatum TaxID=38727 RepID=A0A8T0TD39_PANVG|nr:hypothetical protein PVAP13_4KG050800 [Panicum virgatum]